MHHAEGLGVRVGAEALEHADINVLGGPLVWVLVRAHVAEDVGGHVGAAAGEEGVHEADAVGGFGLGEELPEEGVAVPDAGGADLAVEDVLDKGLADLGALFEGVGDGVQGEGVDDVELVVVAQEEHAEGDDRLGFEGGVPLLEVRCYVEDPPDVGFRDGAERAEVFVDDGEVFVVVGLDFALEEFLVDGLYPAEVLCV